MKKWMVFYKLIDGEYMPVLRGINLIPNENYDKVIMVPEEVCEQIHKFDYDGEKLVKKDGETIMSLEEIKEERQKQVEKNIEDGIIEQDPSNQETEIIY